MNNSKTLVFLPGLGYKASVWDKVIDNLKSEFNIIKIDLPEYGSTWKNKKIISYPFNHSVPLKLPIEIAKEIEEFVN